MKGWNNRRRLTGGVIQEQKQEATVTDRTDRVLQGGGKKNQKYRRGRKEKRRGIPGK